jgi:hypothetical protein
VDLQAHHIAFRHVSGEMVGMAAPGRTTREKAASEKTTARTRTAAPRGRPARARGGAAARATTEEEERGATVPVPVVTPHVKVYRVRVPAPGMSYVGEVGRALAAYVPSPDRLAFYGGLGLAAALGVLDWPVAAAVGIGTMFARRAARQSGRESAQSRPGPRPRTSQR